MGHLINGWQALARSGGASLLVAVIFGFAVSSATAQEAPQAPAAKSDISGWVKICRNTEESGNREVCLVKYEELDPRTGSVLLTAAVRTMQGEEDHLILNLPLAYTLIIPAGVQVRIDEDKPVPLQFGVCLPTSCQAEMALSKETLQKMIKGEKLVVAAVNMQEKPMTFLVPLLGFEKAWQGAPVDIAQYQAARSQMLDFARKTAEAQRAAQQPGPQPGGTAGQPSAPNASTTVPKRVPAPAAQ